LSANTKYFDILVSRNVSFAFSDIKYAPVMAALKSENDYILNQMISRKLVNLKLKDELGNDCLMIAAQNNNIKSLQLLLDTKQFYLFEKNKAGQTAYDIAVSQKKEAMKVLLFKYMQNHVLEEVKTQVHSLQTRKTMANRVLLRHLNNLLAKNKSYPVVVSYINNEKRSVIQNIIREADEAVNKALAAAHQNSNYNSAIYILENAIRNNPEATNLNRARQYCAKLKKNQQYEQERQRVLQEKKNKINRMSSSDIEREVTQFLDQWLSDMRLDKDTSSYWTSFASAKTFFSVKSWQVIGVRSTWSAWHNTVIVQVDSSNKGGMPIRNNWRIVVSRNRDSDFRWRISDIIE
jgi:ankyrin repeat protein